MLTAFPGNHQPPDGKHVPSLDPGATVRDLAGDLARHRAGNDARPTVPQGGWPETAGKDPDAPAAGRSPEMPGSMVNSATPAPYSAAGTAHPGMRADY